MRRPSVIRLGALLAVWLLPATAAAQSPADDPASRARIHLGPLALQPRFDLQNLGIDTNVLNAADDPRRDFTMTFVPGVDAWLRVGPAQLSSRKPLELLYFQKTREQRSTAFSQQARMDLLFSRVRPFFAAERSTSYQRPNAEIDARVRCRTDGGTIGTSLHLGARFDLVLQGDIQRLSFGDGVIDGLILADELDRHSHRASVSARMALTPLTTFVVRGERGRDRFDRAPVRDTDSVAILPGFEFKPSALIAGSAFVGYRRFTPTHPIVPPYAGLVAAVDVRYTWREMTRVAVRASRDVDYSFEQSDPYYLETGATVTITQLLVGAWDAMLRVGRDRLAYRGLRIDDDPLAGARVDRTRTVGAGFGYHLGFGARVGFEVTHVDRRSIVPGRGYDGMRYGGTFTYGS